jgi:23S rRNA pseudouridine1911/1915/1917 synthase
LRVERTESGKRLDVVLSGRALGLTRSQAERLAKQGSVLVEGRRAGPGRRMAAGEVVQVSLPAEAEPEPHPESIPLDILFEDEHVIVVNKPRGMVVHPVAGPCGTLKGRTSGTLVHALLGHTDRLAAGSGSHRPGIVHRLDRGTSGLLVVAKTDAAYHGLARQIRRREAERRYLALVWGNVREDRLLIDVPIGRRQREPMQMAAVPQLAQVAPSASLRAGNMRKWRGKVRPAHTDITVVRRFGEVTLIEAELGTGRTHQIRVHLAHIGHPVVGDPVYGLRQARRRRAGLGRETEAIVRALEGQALHAHFLRFRHPITDQEVTFSAAMPPDMARLISHLGGSVDSGGQTGFR